VRVFEETKIESVFDSGCWWSKAETDLTNVQVKLRVVKNNPMISIDVTQLFASRFNMAVVALRVSPSIVFPLSTGPTYGHTDRLRWVFRSISYRLSFKVNCRWLFSH
jgi:hypothetical protein